MNDSIKFFTRMGDGSGVYMTEKEGNVVGVKRGQEVVYTSDSGCFKVNYQAHIPIDRSTAVLVNERILCMDSVSTDELSDCSVMQDVREELDIGCSMPSDKAAKGMEAKFRIAKLLDIKINSVERFKEKTGYGI